jgi:hypothetical protein
MAEAEAVVATAPSDDNYSSEEELKDIISEQRKKKRSPFAEDAMATEAESNSSASGIGAEKRKWSEAHAEKVSKCFLSNDLGN